MHKQMYCVIVVAELDGLARIIALYLPDLSQIPARIGWVSEDRAEVSQSC